MGFRSKVILAVTKEVHMRDNIIGQKYPSLMKEKDPIQDEDSGFFYWYFEDYKWYPSYPEIIEITEYLVKLNDEEYGMQILHEDNTSEMFGSPWDFDIYIDSQIYSPVRGYH